ncbi:LOW QUALITY PROTEIN: hypothetical protein V2J09_018283 [Rumex salicifolius]
MITQSLKSFSTGRHLAAGSSLFRGFCAATSVHGEATLAAVEEEAPSAGTFADKDNTLRTMWGLYRWISAIGASKDKVANVLDKYGRPCNSEERPSQLSYEIPQPQTPPALLRARLKCSLNLGSFLANNPLWVILEWMDKSKYFYTHKDHALHLDIISTTKGIGEADKLLVEEMKTRNFPMSSYTYVILILSYKQLNDMEAAERTVQEIVKEGTNCHWTVYSNLASMYIKDGNFEKTEMALKKLEELTKNIHFLISFYAHIGNLAAVCRVWEYLKADSGITDNLSYKIMLQAQLKLGQLDNSFEEAEKVFNDAVKKSRKQFFSGRDMLVAYLLDKRRINRVLEHLEAAADANKVTGIWRPSHERIFALCQYFEEKKDVDGAEKLLKLLRRLKCLSSNSYLWLLRIYVAAEKIASDMPHRMKEDGFEVTSEHKVLLEKVCPPP